MILSCTDPTIRKTLLKEAAAKKLTIENALFIGRTIQIATKNAQDIENKDRHNLEEDINKINVTNTSPSKFYQGPLPNSYRNPPSQNNFSHSIEYSNCGYNRPRNRCPAFGKSCSFCNKMNHFSSVCKSSLKQKHNRVHANQISDLIANEQPQPNPNLEQADSVNALYDDYVFAIKKSKLQPDVILHVERHATSFLIDSESSTDIINQATYDEIHAKHNIKLTPKLTKLYPYGHSSALPLLVTVHCMVTSKN